MKQLRNLGECILASKSPRRQEILSIIDLNFKIYPSKINEEEFLEYPPEVSAKLCAEKKAETVSKIFENNLIIAADTLVLYKGKILGKPETETESYEMLNMLSGSIHKVAAKIMGTDSYNGWTYWHYNLNGSTVLIDSLRQKFIAERQI